MSYDNVGEGLTLNLISKNANFSHQEGTHLQDLGLIGKVEVKV